MKDAQARTRRALDRARRGINDVVPGFWRAGAYGSIFKPTRDVLHELLAAVRALDERVTQLEGDAA